jgi:hypothetical protein
MHGYDDGLGVQLFEELGRDTQGWGWTRIRCWTDSSDTQRALVCNRDAGQYG